MEDIEYLRENSREESYLLHISSADRDKTKWPTPAEFRIEFAEPFCNVFALDVLDAQFPRTQFTVNENCNTIALTPPDNVPRAVRLELGLHTDTSKLDALNSVLNPFGITAAFESAPTNLRLTLKFMCQRRFSFDMAQSTINHIIGFNKLAYNHRKAGISFYADAAEPQRFYLMITNPVSSTIYTWLHANYSPEVPEPAALERFYVVQLLSDQSLGILETLQVGVKTGASFDWRVAPSGARGPLATSIASGTASAGSDGFATISFDPRTSPYLDQSTVYWLVMDFKTSNNVPMVAISAPNIPPGSVLSSADQAYWLPYQDDHALIVGKASITVGAQTLVAPGMYDLTGLLYAVLRIPEIESHMYRSRAFQSWNYPLAKFKLALIGYTDSRFNFSTIKPRPFHPIGKLPSITLNFIGADGYFYDFMGVNCSLTLVIRYLVPKPKRWFNSSILNPSYQPNTTVQRSESDSEGDQSEFESSDSD